jgi:putative transposase
MDDLDLPERRNSYMEIGQIYFWTATINGWRHLLQPDAYKDVIIGSLEHLSAAKLIDVFAFVIMPNHIHLIWRMLAANGKESANGSFLKFTAHEFKRMLKQDPNSDLEKYAVVARNKKYEFWQRDPLAIHLYTRPVAYQKMDYLHYNPMAERWQLATEPSGYKYSTAKFYENGIKDYLFIKDLREEF